MVATDEQVFEVAYTTYRDGMVRRLVAMMRDPAAAEDLVQEAFLRLAREMDAGRTPDDVPAWLYRVATNLVASRGRRMVVATRYAGSLQPPAASAEPERMAIEAEQRRALTSALAELPGTDRRALVLAAHGYRGAEIAAVVARSEGATRTLLYRARVKMRELLVESGVALT